MTFFTRQVSNNFLHIFLFVICKHSYKNKEIKKIKKISTKNEQMGDLNPLVGKRLLGNRKYLFLYAQVIIEKFPTSK